MKPTGRRSSSSLGCSRAASSSARSRGSFRPGTSRRDVEGLEPGAPRRKTGMHKPRAGRGCDVKIGGRVNHHRALHRLAACLAAGDDPLISAVTHKGLREPAMQPQPDPLLPQLRNHLVGIESEASFRCSRPSIYRSSSRSFRPGREPAAQRVQQREVRTAITISSRASWETRYRLRDDGSAFIL